MFLHSEQDSQSSTAGYLLIKIIRNANREENWN